MRPYANVRLAPLALFCAVLCTSCKASEADAKKYIEEQGCSDIVVTRDEDGDNKFSFSATCGEEKCAGYVALDGSTSAFTKVCGPPPPDGTTVLGEGAVTGDCDREKVKQTLGKRLPEFDRCYDTILKTYPDAHGSVPLFWTISEEGKSIELVDQKGEMELHHCMKKVLKETTWEKPKEGRCAAQWRVGIYLDEPPTDLGHDRLPKSESCDNPIKLEAVQGERLIETDALAQVLDHTWQLATIRIFAQSDETQLHLRTDHFEPLPPGSMGPIESTSTMLCHTQELTYTVTTTTNDKGEEVETYELTEKNQSENTASTTLPAFIEEGDGKVQRTRELQAKLTNGEFHASTANEPAEEITTLGRIIEELRAMEVPTKALVTLRDEDTLVLKMSLDFGHSQLFVEGTYEELKP